MSCREPVVSTSVVLGLETSPAMTRLAQQPSTRAVHICAVMLLQVVDRPLCTGEKKNLVCQVRCMGDPKLISLRTILCTFRLISLQNAD